MTPDKRTLRVELLAVILLAALIAAGAAGYILLAI